MKDFLRYLIRFGAPHKVRILVSLAILILITLLTLVEPYLYQVLVDTLIRISVRGSDEIHQLIHILAIWGLITIISSGLFALYRYSVEMVFLDVYRDFFLYSYQSIIALDLNKHLEQKTGEAMKKIHDAIESMFSLPFNLLINHIPAWFLGLAIILTSFVVHWPMAIISISLVPLYLGIFLFGVFKTNPKQEQAVDHYYKAIGRGSDAIMNIAVVKSFAREGFEHDLFRQKMDYATSFQRSISRFWVLLSTSEFMLRILTRFMIFAGGIFFVLQGDISIGVVVMFLAFSSYIYGPLQSLGLTIRDIQQQLVRFGKGRELLEAIPLIRDIPNPKILNVRTGKICFADVSFSYHSHKPVLRNVSCVFPAGKVTALVGHSGAGKSTIISLMNRFYTPKSGMITIDEQNIAEVSQESLRESIGMVMQDNTMFNDTIFNNIRYGNLSSAKEAVIEASRQANIHDFIMSLPDRYETIVGERGLKLSGGEKQRVAIARAILKDPPILVLDEATSALDSKTERSIQEALEHLMKDRTTIMIAHRLSTIRKADQIIVLDQGKIAECGTHQELMDKKGIYKNLVDLQIRL